MTALVDEDFDLKMYITRHKQMHIDVSRKSLSTDTAQSTLPAAAAAFTGFSWERRALDRRESRCPYPVEGGTQRLHGDCSIAANDLTTIMHRACVDRYADDRFEIPAAAFTVAGRSYILQGHGLLPKGWRNAKYKSPVTGSIRVVVKDAAAVAASTAAAVAEAGLVAVAADAAGLLSTASHAFAGKRLQRREVLTADETLTTAAAVRHAHRMRTVADEANVPATLVSSLLYSNLYSA
jgi:hypothetical protein